MGALSPFGERLRGWRKRRGMSQLDLALTAGTTPRYVSFVETGRSRPGRGVILRLADAMNVPLRDRNGLLVAAGLPPVYAESAMDDDAMAPVRGVIDQVLEKHEPYPGSVLGQGLVVIRQNRAAERLFPGAADIDPIQMLDMSFAPGPGRDTIENWQEMLFAIIARLRHEVLLHPSLSLQAQLARAEYHAQGLGPAPESSEHPVLCPVLLIGGQRISTISTVMTFESPREVTTSELRVELMFPADAASDAFFRGMAEEG